MKFDDKILIKTFYFFSTPTFSIATLSKIHTHKNNTKKIIQNITHKKKGRFKDT